GRSGPPAKMATDIDQQRKRDQELDRRCQPEPKARSGAILSQCERQRPNDADAKSGLPKMVRYGQQIGADHRETSLFGLVSLSLAISLNYVCSYSTTIIVRLQVLSERPDLRDSLRGLSRIPTRGTGADAPPYRRACRGSARLPSPGGC